MSVVSRVLSELGVSGYSEQQWQGALAVSFSVVDKSLALGQAPTCAGVFSQHKKLNQGERSDVWGALNGFWVLF